MKILKSIISLRYFLLIVICVICTSHSFAATIDCKVVEVTDGDHLIAVPVSGTSRMRIRILGIDAPELGQPIGDLARQHLSQFVLGKTISVAVTGVNSTGDSNARIFSGEIDLGAQMVRDGAAWVDVEDSAKSLDAETLRFYQEAERMARAERRGIWQEDNPTPPWVYRNQQIESARNAELAAQRERAQAEEARRAEERARTQAVPRPAPTPVMLPAPLRGVTHISMNAPLPKGFVVIGIGRTSEKPDETFRAIKRAASGDAICVGTPVPDNFVVTNDVFSDLCPSSPRYNNAMRIDEADAVRRTRVRQAMIALDRAARMYTITSAGSEFSVKVNAARPLVDQAVAVLPEGTLRANLVRAMEALSDADVVRIARSGDYSARLSGDALLALADKYNLNNVSAYQMDSRIVDAAINYFNRAAVEAQKLGYVRLRQDSDDDN